MLSKLNCLINPAMISKVVSNQPRLASISTAKNLSHILPNKKFSTESEHE